MRTRLFLLFVSLCLASLPVKATTTDWVSVTGGAVRLVTAGPMESGIYRAGLEFSLDPGWHTYWRYPGEAGVPPTFDFSGSQNLAKADILYPAPGRYNDGFSTSIVYDENVVLPILITPDDPQAPVRLQASLFFGICKDICVPGDGVFDLVLEPSAEEDTVSAMLIDRDLALVPQTVEGPASGIVSITSAPGKNAPVLTITAKVDPDTPEPGLFAEGPEGSYIGVPDLQSRDGGMAVWTLSTNGLARTGDGSMLTLVLVDGDKAVESRHALSADLLK
ncbi:protein-disulfide reductase DsbD domain-containing protein [Roseibium sp.]|uniref:protein-disulfide reductase DsbD domain-containing protein n=1 Tax=Roseibium sp. TaxID=1936156 RepID=UPI003A97A81C